MGNNVRDFGFGQVSAYIEQLRSGKGVSFRELLNNNLLSEVFSKRALAYRDRIFSPITTLFAFLTQVISADRSCREAVARVNADRIENGQVPASSDTGAYCRARERLPEDLIKELMCCTGEESEEGVPESWLWKGRHLKVVDGTYITTADTKENSNEFLNSPLPQKDFPLPLVRLVVVFSLVTGCALDAVIGPYYGKGNGELSLILRLLQCFRRGDILVADALYTKFYLIWFLKQLGVDVVFPVKKQTFLFSEHGGNFRKDQNVFLYKPEKPEWMSVQMYEEMPETIDLRRIEVIVNRPGFRSKKIVLITTMTDRAYAAPDEIGGLYMRRWQAELNFRSLKKTLNMDFIPAKTPGMVRKEILATLLAYNLIRRIMGVVACYSGQKPHEISFKSTVQTLNQYRHLWRRDSIKPEIVSLFILQSVSRHKVGNRPGRIEPRRVRRKHSTFPTLKITRNAARQLEILGLTA